jgi:hypothetical protein
VNTADGGFARFKLLIDVRMEQDACHCRPLRCGVQAGANARAATISPRDKGRCYAIVRMDSATDSRIARLQFMRGRYGGIAGHGGNSRIMRGGICAEREHWFATHEVTFMSCAPHNSYSKEHRYE